MKIDELKNINYSSKIAARKNEAKSAYPLFSEFSRGYSDAIKARNFSFRGKMSEVELQKKCDELKRELVEDGTIKDESEISWYTDAYVNEGNIQIAKKVFSAKHLENYRKDILKTTNEENLPTARYICDNPDFPLDNVFRILLWTNKENVKASLAMCKRDDVDNRTIDKLVRYVTKYTLSTALKIIEDENFPEGTKPLAISSLSHYSAPFIEKLLDNKDYPRDRIYEIGDTIASREDAEAKNCFYDLLYKGNCRFETIHGALCRVRAESFDYLKEFYEYFKKENVFSAEQIATAISDIASKANAQSKIEIYELIKAQESLNPDEMARIIAKEKVTLKIKKVLEYLKQHPDFPQELKEAFLKLPLDIITNEGICDNDSFYQGAKKFARVYGLMMENPELYVNGEYDTKEAAQDEIRKYIDMTLTYLPILANVFDNATLEYIFRKRLDGVDITIANFSRLNESYFALLKQMVNCKKLNGEEFSSKEKALFIDILRAYQICGADSGEIKIKDNRLDIDELEQNLQRHAFKYCGLEDDEIDKIPKEKRALWNIENTHLLILEQKEMEDYYNTALSDIIRIINSDVDFKSYITDRNNDYGKTNHHTKEMFEGCALNYGAWLNPSKSIETSFRYIDSNEERLSQAILQLEEDIEALRKTPAKSYIDRHFSDCITDGKFKIPPKYAKNKSTLEAFVKNMFGLLDRNIFSRAKENLSNPSKKQSARNTLTIKSHLEQRIKDIQQIDTKKKEKPIDLTIKMWDRNPIKDLFQGNYSTCCIGLGEVNGIASPHYLLNTMFNMIELVDNQSGQTIGNALCYFITNESDKPVFVVDNIEIANKNKMSNTAGIKLRDEIVSYCKKFLKTISDSNIDIVLGKSYNDVPTQDLDSVEYKTANILGKMDCNEIYMDAYEGWSNGLFGFWDEEGKEGKMELFFLSESFA